MVKNGLLSTIFLSIIGILGAIFFHIYVWSDNFYFNRCFNDLFA